MTTIRYALGCFLFVVLFAAASMAQNRTFVSGTGSDSNPCSLSSPCRSFAQAISQVPAGGEVVVLDSAGYGSFTVNKAITVEAPPGVYAGVGATSGAAIAVNATAGVDTVILRGLTIYNQALDNADGIMFNTGGTLHIENCIVNGFTGGIGIYIASPGNFFVKDTIVRGNATGVLVLNRSNGAATLTMDHCRLDDNATQTGLSLETQVAPTATITAAIRNSSLSGNAVGIDVTTANTGSVSLDVESCLITNNAGTGITVSGNSFPPTFDATVSISNCTISRNPVQGFQIQLGGQILSRGNNTITGNGANTGALTPLAGQ